jgi:hypothetical protein
MGTEWKRARRTVFVADVVVKVDLSVVPLAVSPLETSTEDMVVVDADGAFVGRVVETHGD